MHESFTGMNRLRGGREASSPFESHFFIGIRTLELLLGIAMVTCTLNKFCEASVMLHNKKRLKLCVRHDRCTKKKE